MRTSNEIFIPIPKTRNTQCVVLISSTDITNRIRKSKWVLPCTSGIGTFNMVLSNAFGQLNGRFNRGDIVRFYADNSAGTTLQFYGIIDYVKNDISDEGQFLEIDGRHRALLLNEYLICHSATATATSQILSDIIDKLPAGYGFTKVNIGTTTDSMDVKWDYKPFWDCVVELCNKAGYDAYVDNNLDFHYFEENSIANSSDAIVEGDNFLGTKDWGIDSLYEKTRVTVMGQDAEGLPIIYTAIDPNEGSEIKEIFVKDTSANTEDIVQDIAEAKLAEITNKNPQAIIRSYGLETIKPGDNIWIIVPRQQIAGQYKVIQITHEFGMESGGWRTECQIEEEEGGTSKIISELAKSNNLITQSDNVNKLNYSFNFNFDDDTKTGSHSTTQVLNSKLILETEVATDGTWISTEKVASENVTKIEMRVKGKDIWGSEFYYSLNGGANYEQIPVNSFSTLIIPSFTNGKNIKVKVKLIRVTDWNLNPEIESLVLLYS